MPDFLIARLMKRSNNIIVGIDGGGTGCRVAIALQDEKIIGRGKAGPANPTKQPQKALGNLLAAVESARLEAGLSDIDLFNSSAFAGVAGVRDDRVSAFIANGLPFKQVQVVEDRVTSVTGALAGKNGAVAVIGTGSFLARATAGKTQYLGGWGFALGDDASGAWLGHLLLRRVVLSVDGVDPHTDLSREILAEYGGDVGKIYAFSTDATPADFGKLAPMVVGAAAKGDQIATGLMQAGANYIVKALGTIGYRQGEPLCLAGGLGPHYANSLPPQYRDYLIKPKGSALDGALLLAGKLVIV